MYLLISAGIIFCLTVTFTRRRRPWACVSAHTIPKMVLKHRQLLFLSLTWHPPYFLSSIICITPFSVSSSCLLWCLTSLSSCVISRHLKSRVLYKCMQHSSIIHCSSLPDSCRFFFPPPFCGSWPISSVRAPDSEWNITVLFGAAPPTHFLQMPAHKKPFLLWCWWCFSRFSLSFQTEFWCSLSLLWTSAWNPFPQWGYGLFLWMYSWNLSHTCFN